MSKLLEAVQHAAQSPRGPRCSVGQLLDELPAEIATDLTDLLADARNLSSVIAAGLAQVAATEQQPSWEIQSGTLQRHRKGRCLCGRAR